MSKANAPMRVYLAAPLFNDMERSFNLRLACLLESFAQVFLPQRDGKLMRELVRDGMPLNAARQLIFEADTQAIKSCTHLVAVLDGRTVDEGVAFEIGYARAFEKICIGFKTDDRALLPGGDNPMILAGCHEVVGNVIELVDRLKTPVPLQRDVG